LDDPRHPRFLHVAVRTGYFHATRPAAGFASSEGWAMIEYVAIYLFFGIVTMIYAFVEWSIKDLKIPRRLAIFSILYTLLVWPDVWIGVIRQT